MHGCLLSRYGSFYSFNYLFGGIIFWTTTAVNVSITSSDAVFIKQCSVRSCDYSDYLLIAAILKHSSLNTIYCFFFLMGGIVHFLYCDVTWKSLDVGEWHFRSSDYHQFSSHLTLRSFKELRSSSSKIVGSVWNEISWAESLSDFVSISALSLCWG